MSEYEVSDERGCKVVRGAVPINEMVALMNSWAENHAEAEWVADAKLSTHLGVTMVVGSQDATKAWRTELGI